MCSLRTRPSKRWHERCRALHYSGRKTTPDNVSAVAVPEILSALRLVFSACIRCGHRCEFPAARQRFSAAIAAIVDQRRPGTKPRFHRLFVLSPRSRGGGDERVGVSHPQFRAVYSHRCGGGMWRPLVPACQLTQIIRKNAFDPRKFAFRREKGNAPGPIVQSRLSGLHGGNCRKGEVTRVPRHLSNCCPPTSKRGSTIYGRRRGCGKSTVC